MLRLLARGLDFPQISKQLELSVTIARRHLGDAMTHYRATNATHTVALAIAAGDLPPNIATQE